MLRTPNQKQSKFTSNSASKFNRLTQSNKNSTGAFGSRKRLYPTRNQSLQSSFALDESSHHYVENIGTSLPVLITEALTLAEGHAHITVRMDRSEWAWLVCNRRLFVWRYVSGQSKTSQCKELTLSPSDLAHTAHLVTLISSPTDQHGPSCVAVSPEGIIRYWPSIAHEGSFKEISADLKGEECATLIDTQPFGCIVATTTSSLLQISFEPGQSSIQCRLLAPPQGTLLGIGRRMSSFIFGAVSSPSIGAPLHQVLAGEIVGPKQRAFYVLSGKFLQKWTISENEPEKMLYQFEAKRMIREYIAKHYMGRDASLMPSLQVWLLDMQITRDGVQILAGSVNKEGKPMQMVYMLASVNTEGLEPPEDIMCCVPIRYMAEYELEEEEPELLNYRLLVPSQDNYNAYLFNSNVCISLRSEPDCYKLVEKMDFHSVGDKLLGTGSHDGQPVFFSRKHGIVVAPKQTVGDITFDDSAFDKSKIMETSVSIDASRMEDMSRSEDSLTRLKGAVLLSIQGRKAEALAIIKDLFPTENTALISKLCINLSQEIIDEFPAVDPRWAESAPPDSTCGVSSLIILHQLQDKLKAHNHLLTFLQEMGLWEKLGVVNLRDSRLCAYMILCEHGEKLSAAIALRNLHTKFPKLIDTGIKAVLEERTLTEDQNSGLSPQDIFYREVSKIEDIIYSLSECMKDTIKSEMKGSERLRVIKAVNAVFSAMLNEANEYRKNKTQTYCYNLNNIEPSEFLPWTALSGNKGTRSILRKQFNITVDHGLLEAREADIKSALLQQVHDLADLILHDYQQQLDWPWGSTMSATKSANREEIYRAFVQERHNLIMPLLQLQCYDYVAMLAEKYKDYEALARLCEETNNQQRLQYYMSEEGKFEGFTDFILKWYMEEGKRGKVMTLSLPQRTMSRFFDAEENKFMGWINDISTGNYTKAHTTLKELAIAEKGNLSKKKTLLSLSKLAAFASDESVELADNVQGIIDEHDLLLHQETLPPEVFETLGIDPEKMKVMSVKELIQLYVGEYNVNASAYDFKIALDLLSFLPENDPDIDELRLHIWAQAIKRDDWSEVSIDDPLSNNKETTFFRTAELAFREGLNLYELMPSVDELLSYEDLGDLRHNKTFQYLVRAGFEHMQTRGACE